MPDKDTQSTEEPQPSCSPHSAAGLSGIEVVALSPVPTLPDYRAALALARRQADEHLGDHMLLSWYDRDRDFESPQHSSECHADSAVPGYVDYGCLLYTSPSPRDGLLSRMPSSA